MVLRVIILTLCSQILTNSRPRPLQHVAKAAVLHRDESHTTRAGKSPLNSATFNSYTDCLRNTRRRPCDKVWPADIDTAGLTQIIFSFATIDPTTFAVGPMHPDDEKLYTYFLGLKDGSQKWIGIGEWPTLIVLLIL